MMKKVKLLLLATLFLILSVGQTGCYGPFRLTNNLYNWNGTVGEKFENALVFFAFVVIPVYEVSLLVDGLVLNTIEFWGGDNPITMKEGDKKVKMVKKDGEKYKITATKNKFHIEQLEGADKGKYAELIFDPATESWSLKDGDKDLQKLVDIDGDVARIYKPNGETISVDVNNYDVALIKQQIYEEVNPLALK